MFSIVPVLDELFSSYPTHHTYQPSYLSNVSLIDNFRNQLGFSNEIKTVEDNKKQLTLAVNCESFKPEQINVSIKDKFVVIEGNYEEKDEHSYVKRQFSRKFLLPENAIQEKMECSLSQNGVLKVTIPKQQAKEVKNEAVNIPIQFSK